MVSRATPAAAMSAAGRCIWSARRGWVQEPTRASPKARLSALQRMRAARASGVSPPHCRWASTTGASDGAPLGIIIKLWTYCTMSSGSTRTVRNDCRSFAIGPSNVRLLCYCYGAYSTEFQGRLERMNGDLLFLVIGTGILGVAYKAWENSLDARQTANRIAKDACARAVVQFLDGTVAFAGFRLGRDSRGKRR